MSENSLLVLPFTLQRKNNTYTLYTFCIYKCKNICICSVSDFKLNIAVIDTDYKNNKAQPRVKAPLCSAWYCASMWR